MSLRFSRSEMRSLLLAALLAAVLVTALFNVATLRAYAAAAQPPTQHPPIMAPVAPASPRYVNEICSQQPYYPWPCRWAWDEWGNATASPGVCCQWFYIFEMTDTMTSDVYSAFGDAATAYNNDTSIYIGWQPYACTSPCSGHKISAHEVWNAQGQYWSGNTTRWYNMTNGNMTQALIEVNSFIVENYVHNEKRSVISHEMMHALGLDHNNTTSCDPNTRCCGGGYPVLMYYTDWRYDACGVYTQQWDERNGINSLY